MLRFFFTESAALFFLMHLFKTHILFRDMHMEQIVSPTAFLSHIGKRVQILPAPPIETVRTGIIRFSGTTEFAEGAWVGVELDTEWTGKNNGSVQGKEYFKVSSPGQGVFVRPELVQLMAESSVIVVELRSEIEVLQAKLAASDKKIAELNTSTEALQIDVEIAKEEKLLIEDELEMLKRRVELGEGEPAAGSSSTTNTTTGPSASSASVASEAAVERIQFLERKLAAQEETNLTLRSRVAELTQQLEDADSSNDAALLQAVMDSKLDLESQVETQKVACDKLRRELAEFESLTQMQAEELTSQQHQASEYERAQEKRVELLTAALRESELMAQKTRAKIASLEQELSFVSKSDREKQELLAVSQAVVAAARSSAAQLQAKREAAMNAQQMCATGWQKTVADTIVLFELNSNSSSRNNGKSVFPPKLAAALGACERSVLTFNLSVSASSILLAAARSVVATVVATTTSSDARGGTKKRKAHRVAVSETVATVHLLVFRLCLLLSSKSKESALRSASGDSLAVVPVMQSVFELSSALVEFAEAVAHNDDASADTSTNRPLNSAFFLPAHEEVLGAIRRVVNNVKRCGGATATEGSREQTQHRIVPRTALIAMIDCISTLTKDCGSIARDMLELLSDGYDEKQRRTVASSPLADFVKACEEARFPDTAAAAASSGAETSSEDDGASSSSSSLEQQPVLGLSDDLVAELCQNASSVFSGFQLLSQHFETVLSARQDGEDADVDVGNSNARGGGGNATRASARVQHVLQWTTDSSMKIPSSSVASSAADSPSSPWQAMLSDCLEQHLTSPSSSSSSLSSSTMISVVRGAATSLQRIWGQLTVVSSEGAERHAVPLHPLLPQYVSDELMMEAAANFQQASGERQTGEADTGARSSGGEDVQKLTVELQKLQQRNAALQLAEEKHIVLARELETERSLHGSTKTKLQSSEKEYSDAIRVLEQRLATAKAELRSATATIAAASSSSSASLLLASAASSGGGGGGGGASATVNIPAGVEREKYLRALSLLAATRRPVPSTLDGSSTAGSNGRRHHHRSLVSSFRCFCLSENFCSQQARWRAMNDNALDWYARGEANMKQACMFEL